MALKTVVVEEDGKTISYEPLKREYSTTFFGLVTNWLETTTTEVTEWYALTEDAAKDYADGAAQPETGTYTFKVDLDSREIGAYKLTRTYVVTTTEVVT